MPADEHAADIRRFAEKHEVVSDTGPASELEPKGRTVVWREREAVLASKVEERCPRCGMAMVCWPPGQRMTLDCVDARCRAGLYKGHDRA